MAALATAGHNNPPDDVEAPEADDYAARMPSDKSEATKFFWTYYQRIMADRKLLAETRTASAKDIASDYKVKPPVVRLGFRVARMTPEKRQAHADVQNKIFGLFGYTPLGVADEASTDPKFASALEVDKYVAEQQRTLGIKMKELIVVAKGRGVDVPAVAELYKFRRAACSKNGNEDTTENPAAEFFDRVDAVGGFLEVWKV
jgi:hypothetical protein